MSDLYGQPPEQPQQPGQPGQPGGPPQYQYGQQPPPPHQPHQPGYGAPAQRGPDGLTADERTWGGAAHWSALVAALIALAFLGPLLVLLAKGNDSPYVRAQASESLNFQLSMLIYGAVGAIVGVVLSIVTLGIGLVLVVPAALAFAAFWLIFTIMGSVRSANGEVYRYPLTIRMVS